MLRVTGTSAPVSTRDNYWRVLIYLFRAATKLGHGDEENISHTVKSQAALLVGGVLFLYEETKILLIKSECANINISSAMSCPWKQTNTSQPSYKTKGAAILHNIIIIIVLFFRSWPDPACTLLNFIFLQKSLINYINLHQGCLHLAVARQSDQSDLQNNNVCFGEG